MRGGRRGGRRRCCRWCGTSTTASTSSRSPCFLPSESRLPPRVAAAATSSGPRPARRGAPARDPPRRSPTRGTELASRVAARGARVSSCTRAALVLVGAITDRSSRLVSWADRLLYCRLASLVGGARVSSWTRACQTNSPVSAQPAVNACESRAGTAHYCRHGSHALHESRHGTLCIRAGTAAKCSATGARRGQCFTP